MPKENCPKELREVFENYERINNSLPEEGKRALFNLAKINCKKPCLICPLQEENREEKKSKLSLAEWCEDNNLFNLNKLEKFKKLFNSETPVSLTKFNFGLQNLKEDFSEKIENNCLDLKDLQILKEFEEKQYSLILLLPFPNKSKKEKYKFTKLRDFILSNTMTSQKDYISLKDLRSAYESYGEKNNEDFIEEVKVLVKTKGDRDNTLVSHLVTQFEQYNLWTKGNNYF